MTMRSFSLAALFLCLTVIFVEVEALSCPTNDWMVIDSMCVIPVVGEPADKDEYCGIHHPGATYRELNVCSINADDSLVRFRRQEHGGPVGASPTTAGPGVGGGGMPPPPG